MSSAPTRGPVQRPDIDRDLSEIFQRLDDLERANPALAGVLNVAHARFTGPEIEDGAVKPLVGAVDGTIIVPLDFYLVPSDDFSFGEDTPGVSTMELDSDARTWYAFTLQGFGTTQWVSMSAMEGDPNTGGIPRSVIGVELTVKSAAGAGLTVFSGEMEVFVRWYRAKITT